MVKKQGSSSSAPAWLQNPFLWRLLILVISVGVFCGGAYLGWLRLKPRILSSPDYRVGPEQVEITPLPDWIHRKTGEFQREVFCDPRLAGPLSIMDDDLLERIKQAFAEHPWVAKVTGVAKRHPAAVKVDLVYRRPVCMVELPGKAWAIDVEGVILPSEDFSPVEATRYPHAVGVDREPTVPVGHRWADAKVVGGAEIAAAFGPDWEAMKLERIVALDADPAAAANKAGDSRPQYREPFFVLFTRRVGTRVLWGYAPGANVLGEIPAAEKVARLKRYVAQYDSLDGAAGQRQELDVRTLSKGGGAAP
jgi:hypothetical protein